MTWMTKTRRAFSRAWPQVLRRARPLAAKAALCGLLPFCLSMTSAAPGAAFAAADAAALVHAGAAVYAPRGVHEAAAVEFRAQLVAKAQAVLSSERSGKIVKVGFRDGDRFQKGDVLLEYDCALPKARLARAEAALSAANGRWKNASELRKLHSISAADFEEARAGAGMARAEMEAERIEVGRCRIEAPFSGVVGEAFVRAHEYVGEGQKLLTIYDVSSFDAEAILPAAALKALRIGTMLEIALDDTGAVYPLRVSRIAGSVDPVSQSVKVTGELIRPAGEAEQTKEKTSAENIPLPVLPGMSGSIRWSPRQ